MAASRYVLGFALALVWGWAMAEIHGRLPHGTDLLVISVLAILLAPVPMVVGLLLRSRPFGHGLAAGGYLLVLYVLLWFAVPKGAHVIAPVFFVITYVVWPRMMRGVGQATSGE
ncbi:MAG: hypothetical protein AAGD14_14015 [Planctomycetota bacterium]